VLVDGRPDFMGIFGHPLMDAYRTDNVDRIEVVRGPASALYGTNAMGGAVNIVTRAPREHGVRTTAGVALGSHDTREYTADVSAQQGSGSGTLSVSRRQTDGHRPRSRYETINLSGRAGQRLGGAWSVSAGGYLADFYSEEPGTVYTPKPNGFADVIRGGVDVTLGYDGDGAHTVAKLHGTFGKHRLGDGFRSTDRILGLVLFQAFHAFDATKLSAGLDLKRYGGGSRNALSGADFGSHWVTEAAPHVHFQQLLGSRLIASGGLRWEHHSLFGGVWIPDAGLVLQPNEEVSLRGAMSRGFHSPNVKDLYLPFPAANPDLQPERLWSMECGGEVRLGKRLRLDIAVYRQAGEGTIHPAFGPGGPSLVNGGQYTSYGVEFSADVRLAPGWRASLAYARFSDPETSAGMPGQSLAVSLGWVRGPFSVQFTGTQVRDLYGLSGRPPRPGRLEDYGVVNARGAYRAARRIRIHAQMDNVFDNAYQTQYGYPMPGRIGRVGMDILLGPRTR